MTDIKNSISGAAGKATEALGSVAQGAGNALKDIDLNKIAPYLLAGGVGAAAGALTTGKRRKKKGEGRLSHLGRVLSNALMAGGLAGGGAALLHKGYKSTVGAADDVAKATTPNEGPLESTLRGAAFSPLTAGAAGAAGLAATHGSKTFGAGGDDAAKHLKALAVKLGLKETDLQGGITPTAVSDRIRATADPSKIGKTIEDLERNRRMANVAGDNGKLHRIASRVSRSGPLSTFGPTWGRRAGRGALGLTAAAIPAIVGSFATKEQPSA